MADWVLKGSLKGPQGDPGADAQLPEGGTTGDFLQKTADGTGWFNSEGLLRASYVGTLQQIGDDAQSLEIHDVSVTSNGYVAGIDTADPQTDGAYVYADDTNNTHLGHNRVGVEGGIPYVDLQTGGEGTHLAADGRYSYVDDIEAADTAQEEGGALTIPTGAAVKQYVADHAGDALPEGGTAGQVLTKTGTGESWADVPQPDLSAYVTDTELGTELDTAFSTRIQAGTGISVSQSAGDVTVANAAPMPSVVAVSQGGTGVTTADALTQLVFENAPEASPTQAGVVKTLSDQDFCEYMGIDYNPDDWS